MKKILFSLSLTAITLFVAAQTEAEMKAWQAYMTPGEMHKNMASSVGDWKAEVTMWMEPGAQPTKSTATATNEMLMEGRYLKSTHKGNFMGMPFEGISITGYDNIKKTFVNTWIDNMGTGVMVTEGKWNKEKNAIELTGKATDPMTGKDSKIRETLTFNADGSQLMEMWSEKDGKEFKTMEIKMTKS